MDVVIKSNGIEYREAPLDFYHIYKVMMKLTNGDHEISQDAASWCELAHIGEIYEFREGTIEIIER